MQNRKSGILLHISSLPGKEGIGTLGSDARKFIDLLKETGQKVWQILPLGPVGPGYSPYQCFSAFAGFPLFIDLKILQEEDLLTSRELDNFNDPSPSQQINYPKLEAQKYPLLRKAFQRFHSEKFQQFEHEYLRFLDVHGWWLHDYALFMAAREHFGNLAWHHWSHGLKHRHPEVLRHYSELLAENIDFQKFMQFMFFRQWYQLKNYANEQGIEILGDLPLYVSTDSSDVWANTDLFLLDEELNPIEIGGVPPDYFSETGQLWGNPVFNWERLKQRNYDWWIARLHFNLNLYNRVRIDHFRGLESYWSIPAKEETAINGRWVRAYGYEMLALLKSQIGKLPFVAEDLGIITPEVDKLRNDFGLPGMRILQFAFTTDATNKNLPHNYDTNTVVYTGTHDNNTTLGWLKSITASEQAVFSDYISETGEQALRKMIEMAEGSVAETAIISMQDLLALDENSRMNTPGTAFGNWTWRFSWDQLRRDQVRFLKHATQKYNR